jgi:hypothetical protein
MVRRPDSIPEARRAMREALQDLESRGETTPCQDRPVPYTEVRQSPAQARELCAGCPIIEICAAYGFTESVYADDMVYGGFTWRRGVPIVSETAYVRKKRSRAVQQKPHGVTLDELLVPAKLVQEPA